MNKILNKILMIACLSALSFGIASANDLANEDYLTGDTEFSSLENEISSDSYIEELDDPLQARGLSSGDDRSTVGKDKKIQRLEQKYKILQDKNNALVRKVDNDKKLYNKQIRKLITLLKSEKKKYSNSSISDEINRYKVEVNRQKSAKKAFEAEAVSLAEALVNSQKELLRALKKMERMEKQVVWARKVSSELKAYKEGYRKMKSRLSNITAQVKK